MHHKVKTHPPRPGDPIGVFDSGVGGLSTLRYMRRLMPAERFIFLADQAYVPYGAKTAAQLQKRSLRIARFLIEKEVKCIVIACNTATCCAIEHLRERLDLPLIGTVPAVKPACERTRTGVVAILATPATAQSAMLAKLIRQHARTCRVIRIGCAGLEEAVEQGSLKSSRTRELLTTYVNIARAANADQIVLGCTHYPFLKRAIRAIFPVSIVDSAPAIARRVRHVLLQADLLRPPGDGRVSYWTTGDIRSFSRVASTLMRQKVKAKMAKI